MFASSLFRILIAAILLAGVLFAYTRLANTLSIRDSSAVEQTEDTLIVATLEDKSADQEQHGDPEPQRLDYEEIDRLLEFASPKQRKALLSDRGKFAAFVNNEAINKSLLAAVRAIKLDENENSRFLAERGAERVLRELYIGQYIQSRIPEGFPTDEQVQAYYHENRDKFVLGERVPLWQILLPITEAMSNEDRELLERKAVGIYQDLKNEKLDFAQAAQQYSSHESGKASGGYMGLVKMSDLKPDVRKILLELKPGLTGEPLVMDDAIHLVKRGEIIEEQVYTPEQVSDEIRKQLDTRLQRQLRQELYEQAKEAYPVDINEQEIEKWRQNLLGSKGREIP